MAETKKNDFDSLIKMDVSKYVEKKNGLNYLSWAFAWKEFKKAFPTATYRILRGENGLPYVFDEKTGYMVFTEITIDEVTHEMWLPVMDSNNFAMKNEPYEVKTKYKTFTVASATMFDVNKAIMRCLVKNIAVCSGIGLSLYASEDLPFEEEAQPVLKNKVQKETITKKSEVLCEGCKRPVEAGGNMTAEQVAEASKAKYGKIYCSACRAKKRQAEEAKKQILEAKGQTEEEVNLPFPLD